MKTYFIDFDGVLIKNSGKFGLINWDNNDSLLMDNCLLVKQLCEKGAQIVITTSRPENYRLKVQKLLNTVGIEPYAILMGLNHAPRVLINDFAPSNPFPSAEAINIVRNSYLLDYIS